MKAAALSDLLISTRAGYWGGRPGEGDTDVRVIRNGDVKPNSGVLWDQLPARSMSKKQAGQSRVTPDDLLITTSGECGVTAFVGRDPQQATCSSNFVRILRADPHVVDPRYLFHFTTTRDFRDALRPFIRGRTLQNLSTRDAFAAVKVPLPPVEEQRRIAAILDQADALRAKRRQALAHLDALKQSIFLDMFSALAADARVEEVAQDEKGSIRTGPFGSQLLHSEFVDDGIAVLGLDNVVSDRFRWVERRYITQEKYQTLKRYTVSPGDVLISIMGTCGRCVIVPDGIPTAINTKHICAISVDRNKVVPDFLRACFLWHPDSRRYLLKRAKGSIMDGLNMGIIKEMPMPLPTLDLQRDFVRRVQAVELLQDAASRSMDELERLVSSLQQRAFAGRL
jgi:type I restriction enzyme S subunit